MSLRRFNACLVPAAVCLGVALGWVGEARGGQYLWDASGNQASGGFDGDGTWDTSTATNWVNINDFSSTSWPNNATEDDLASFGFGDGPPGGTLAVGTVTANQLYFLNLLDPSYHYTLGTAPNQGTITLAGSVTPMITLDRDATINSVLAGTSGLTVTGYNTLTLAGNNTYSGPTTITPSLAPVTLLVNGTHAAGAGTYGVAADGRIGGAGTITTTGTFLLDSGALITGGDFGTVGTLTIAGAGARTLAGTYQIDVDYGAAQEADLLRIINAGGSLDLTGSAFSVNVINGSAIPAAGSHYAIKVFEADVADTAYAAPGQHDYLGSTPGLAAYQSIITWDNGKTFYLVPEPTSLALLGLGGLLLLRRPSRRRGR